MRRSSLGPPPPPCDRDPHPRLQNCAPHPCLHRSPRSASTAHAAAAAAIGFSRQPHRQMHISPAPRALPSTVYPYRLRLTRSGPLRPRSVLARPRRASKMAGSPSPSSCRRRLAVGQPTWCRCQRRFPQTARHAPTIGSGTAPSQSAPPWIQPPRARGAHRIQDFLRQGVSAIAARSAWYPSGVLLFMV